MLREEESHVSVEILRANANRALGDPLPPRVSARTLAYLVYERNVGKVIANGANQATFAQECVDGARALFAALDVLGAEK